MGDVGQSPVSRRAAAVASVPSQQRINAFLRDSDYSRRRHEPGICDFVLGNPHAPLPAPAAARNLSSFGGV
jgi:aspartate aminotransferase